MKILIAINAHACPFLSRQIPGDRLNLKVPTTDRQEVKFMLKEAVTMLQQKIMIYNKPKEPQKEPQAKTIQPSSSSHGCVECCTVT